MKRSRLPEMRRDMLKAMLSYEGAIHEQGYFLATQALEANGFTAVRKIADEDRVARKNDQRYKISYGSLMASKARKRYVIQLETRRKFEKNGQPNRRYKLTHSGFEGDFYDDVRVAEYHWGAKAHWIAVQIDIDNDIYSVFFGSLEQLGGKSAIPMGDSNPNDYVCLARQKRLTDTVGIREPGGDKNMSKVPPGIQESLKLFRQDHRNPSKTAFIMMQFGKTPAHIKIVTGIRGVLEKRGISALRADDKQYHDDLFPNVLTYTYGCGFGIAVFERIEADRFNPNVALEVGYLMALKKPVCLLKDKTLPTLNTDLVGKLYKQFDPQNPEETIATELTKWLRDKKIIR